MTEHSKRAHAVLSASGSHRWLKCTASALLEQQFPDTTSEAAREGTLAHELAEAKLRRYFFEEEYSKRKLIATVNKLKKDELWSEEMQGYTDTYLDLVKRNALSYDSRPYMAIETRLDLSDYIPRGFGTADCIICHDNELVVIDFKYGKGVAVSAEHNTQMMLYALGAHRRYKMFYDIKTVTMEIVQPRISDEPSTWSCSIEELLTFGEVVKAKAEEALSGKGVFAPEEETCRFCRARATCRARADKNVELAFMTEVKPETLANDEVGAYIKKGLDVAKWLKDLQEYALSECLAGRLVTGWKAVEGRSSRDWTDMDKAFEAVTASGVKEEMLWERKPLTLAQVEKLMGKKEFAQVAGEYVVRSPGKPTLVPESDKREAITSRTTAKEAFTEEV